MCAVIDPMKTESIGVCPEIIQSQNPRKSRSMIVPMTNPVACKMFFICILFLSYLITLISINPRKHKVNHNKASMWITFLPFRGLKWYYIFMGSKKQSIASKRQWAKLTLSQRQKRMKKLSRLRWVGMTPDERARHASKIAKARWKQWRLNNKIHGTKQTA